MGIDWTDREDDEPPPETVPAEPKVGERFREKTKWGLWDVYDWSPETCDCVGGHDEYGHPLPKPDCPECNGTWQGPLAPDRTARDLTEADATLLVEGKRRIETLEADLRACLAQRQELIGLCNWVQYSVTDTSAARLITRIRETLSKVEGRA